MIIDCHYHLEKSRLRVGEMIQRMDACGIDKVALMAVMNDPIVEASVPTVKLLNFLLSHKFTRKVGRSLVDSFTPQNDLNIGGKRYRLYPHPDNKSVFDAVDLYPDRFYAWVFVRPDSDIDPVEELQRWMSHPGFVGVKAHPFWHRYPPKKLLSVAEIIASQGKPLLIHAGYEAHGDFLRLVDKVPDLKLILAHAGFPGYKSTWKAIKNRPNIFVDLSQSSYVSSRVMKAVVQYLGIDRCLFGTDGPYGFRAGDGKFDFAFIKKRIEKLFPSQEAQQRLFGRNFQEIAGLL